MLHKVLGPNNTTSQPGQVTLHTPPPSPNLSFWHQKHHANPPMYSVHLLEPGLRARALSYVYFCASPMTKMHDPPRPASRSSQSRPAPTVHRAFSPCISPLAPVNRALGQWEAWVGADKEMGDGEDGGELRVRRAGQPLLLSERVNAG